MGLSAAYILDANGAKVFTPTETNFNIIQEVPGVLTATTNVAEFKIRAPGGFILQKVLLTVATAPTGADLIVDVNAGGSSIFATANRPTIAAAATSGESSAMLATQAARKFTDATVITVDVDQIGSGVAGADLAVQIIGQAL